MGKLEHPQIEVGRSSGFAALDCFTEMEEGGIMGKKLFSISCVVALAALMASPGPASAIATPILQGRYLLVGVDDSGGLIDDDFNVGIDYDITGTSTWTGYDFLKPGTPWEFYSIGVNGSWNVAGYVLGNPFGCTSTDTSTGSMNSARTVGSYGALAIQQDLWYHDDSAVIEFLVVLTNTSGTEMVDVVYARGLDPDQDVYAGGWYDTDNEIVGSDLVYASAPITDWTIGIYSNSAYPHTPSVDAIWDTNPYNLLVPHHDGDSDYTINMAFNIGVLGPGQSAQIAFEYRIGEQREDVIGEIPEPATIALLGVVGLGALIRRRRQRLA